MAKAEIKDAFESAPAVSGKRVLIAEDSSVTQDLLKLLLSQRGHSVDLAGDGEEALQKLRATSYDVAFLDFHLPKRNGLEVAAAYLQRQTGPKRPRLVAMTADVEGLFAHGDNCETFDDIVPKPLDIDAVSRIVDSDNPPLAASPARERLVDRGDSSNGREPARPRRSAIDALGLDLLRWPADFESRRLSVRGLQAQMSNGRFDAILIEAPVTVAELAVVWRTMPLHLLPVIDLTGTLGPRADIDGSKLAYGESERATQLIAAFRDRRVGLHRDLWQTEYLGEKLFGRICASGGNLFPAYDPLAAEFVCHNTVLDEDLVVREAEKLCKGGFLRSTFFDRLNLCSACGSSRLNVREECVKCGSPQLVEEPYLHHFKCAYQGPESDFRAGNEIVCPKCRRSLRHFSVDYDKPGFVVKCLACSHSASESRVAFLCVDCGARTAGDAARTRDVLSYSVTDRGRDFAEIGHAFLGHTERSLRFAELPLDLVVALNGEARRFNEDGRPFTLLDVAYRNARIIDREHGPRQFAQARDQFLENLRNLLRPGDLLVKGQLYDFVLMKNTNARAVRGQVDRIHGETTRPLRLDLGVTIRVFGPEDFV